jgi:peptidoglycan/xylan/chitin deacetylase (PgdA/CDA1 family)
MISRAKECAKMPSGHALARAQSRTERDKCYFSIDLEDYAHDYQRALGVKSPKCNPDSLAKAYQKIEFFAQQRLSGARLTFFTTGQVARDYPDLVRRIADDGHEIACHYLEHDQIWHQDKETFRRNLEIAVEHLSKASGQIIQGFRAPDFSIDERCAGWAYEELSRLFVYDSSSVTDGHAGKSHCPEVFRFSGSYLHELPLFRRKLLPGLAVRVIGGTYMRLLPVKFIVKLLREAHDHGFIPQVYLHPYDLLYDYEQWSRYDELSDLPVNRRIYWWLRQNQWHSIGNRGAFRKLEQIYDEFEHPGPIASLFNSGNTIRQAHN